METLPELISRRRRELGLSQGALAHRVRIRPQTLSQIERGLAEPKPATFRRLLASLRIADEDAYQIAMPGSMQMACRIPQVARGSRLSFCAECPDYEQFYSSAPAPGCAGRCNLRKGRWQVLSPLGQVEWECPLEVRMLCPCMRMVTSRRLAAYKAYLKRRQCNGVAERIEPCERTWG